MEKEQEICFGFLGNGITVWTSCVGKNGHLKDPDYKAHISPERKITYYQENTPKYFIDAVEKKAQDNFIAGNDSDYFVLIPKNKPTKYCDTRFYGRVLIHEEMCDCKKHLCLKSGQIVDDWKNVKDIDPNDKRPVFIIGNFKRNNFGELYGSTFGFSFSKEVAEDAAEQIRKWKTDYWRHCEVEECTQDFLVKCSNKNLRNLDWEED